jgi:hypothetical protein
VHTNRFRQVAIAFTVFGNQLPTRGSTWKE